MSKRELYSEFRSKAGILGALIAKRAERMRKPLDQAEVGDRAGLPWQIRGKDGGAVGDVSARASGQSE